MTYAATQARALELKRQLGLQPHPEGGAFSATYRAPLMFGSRPVSTAIHYMLEAGEVSCFHRLKSDELWHFHEGGPLVVVELRANGALTTTALGPAFQRGEVFQHAVAAGTWFGAFLADGAAYALVSCTVSPGFDYADFEIAERGELLSEFPTYQAMIERLTRREGPGAG